MDLSEAAAIDYIARNTSIPVPKIYCAFEHDDTGYIVMERLKGVDLYYGWYQRSEESKAKILSQLKGYVDEMRCLSPPGPMVSNVDGGSLEDPRITVKTHRWGPFTSVQAFHQFLHEGAEPNPEIPVSKWPEGMMDLFEWHAKPWPTIKFTHGDLSSFNILVDGDTVTGIIDWQTAGWFPSYWEYTNARQVSPLNEFWAEEIDKFLEPFPEAHKQEVQRQRYFGEFGPW